MKETRRGAGRGEEMESPWASQMGYLGRDSQQEARKVNNPERVECGNGNKKSLAMGYETIK